MLRIKTMKQFIKIFLSSLLIAVILTPLKSGCIMYGELSAFSISSFIGAIIISIWTIFCLNKYEGKLKIAYVLISILAGISFLDLLFFLTQITHFKSALLYSDHMGFGNICRLVVILRQNKHGSHCICVNFIAGLLYIICSGI